jgi:hypothetical protein
MILELCFVALSQAQQEPPPPAAEEPKISVEDEVLANLNGLEIAPIHVADLALPEDFMRRVSDRIIRSSFEDSYRLIVPDPKPGEGGQAAVLGAPPADGGHATWWKSALLVTGAVVGAVFVMLGIFLKRRRRQGAA